MAGVELVLKTGLGPVLQLAVFDPPGPSKAAIRGQGALQVDARVWHLHVIANGLSIFGHQAESRGRDLAADAGCNVSHFNPVEFPDVQVLTIERLYLDLDTVEVARDVSGPPPGQRHAAAGASGLCLAAPRVHAGTQGIT